MNENGSFSVEENSERKTGNETAFDESSEPKAMTRQKIIRKSFKIVLLNYRNLFWGLILIAIVIIIFQESLSGRFKKRGSLEKTSVEKTSANPSVTAQKNEQLQLDLSSAGFYSKEAMNEAKAAIRETSKYSGWSESEILALIIETNQYFKGHDYSPSMVLSFTTETINLFHAIANLPDSDFNYMLFKLSGRKAAIRQAIQIEASLINASEISSILIASMYKPSNNGFRYVPGIDKNYLEETFNRMNGPLLDSGTLGHLNSIFDYYDRETQRHARRAIGEYLRALSYKECQKLLAVMAKMRGYKSYQDCFEQKAYEFKLSPLVAHFLARVMVREESQKKIIVESQKKIICEFDTP